MGDVTTCPLVLQLVVACIALSSVPCLVCLAIWSDKRHDARKAHTPQHILPRRPRDDTDPSDDLLLDWWQIVDED